jgi:hypothetical protein
MCDLKMDNVSITQREFPASIYEPLKYPVSIRLLLLEPPTLADPDMVKGRIEYTTLTHYEHEIIEPYTALSYVWGDPSIKKTTFIDEVPVQVTSNLYDALRDIRDERRVMRLWADALCINQNDNDEKATQIGLMGRIYSVAGCTVIYLGASDSNEDGPATSTVNYKAVDKITLDVVFRSPWFRRAWVYQEAVLSRDPRIQYARWRFTWGHFAIYISQEILHQSSIFWQIHRARSSYIYENLKTLKSYRYNLNCLAHAVSSRRGFGASDPRDLVVAYLGMATTTNGVC